MRLASQRRRDQLGHIQGNMKATLKEKDFSTGKKPTYREISPSISTKGLGCVT